MSQITKYLTDYQPPVYLVETVDLIVDLDEAFTIVRSQLRVRANNHAGDVPLVLNGEMLELVSVALQGQVLTIDEYELTDKNLIILHPGAYCELDIAVKIMPQHNTTLMGLYKSSGNFCTQCEAEGFRKITYYIDRPDNLAIFTVTIVADKANYPVLLSNGNKVDSGELANNKHWAKWHDPHKKSPHLFALVAGKFDVLDDEFITMNGRKVKLRLFVEPGNLDKCDHAMKALKQSMRWDEEVYGREYDLDIFMTVAVGDFNMGAMENKGLNIFNTKYILANQKTATDLDFMNITRVVGHEYFHNWSGNRVGCRDWFQLSLKEGFTVFRDQVFTGDMSSPAVRRIQDVDLLRTAQFKEDAGPMAHPIRPASYIEINNFYTLTVYEKGAEVIRMMFTLLGPEKYRKGTDLYFSRFDGQAVTTDDFVDCMQEASGVDLTQFRLWYSQSGTPHLQVSDEYDSNNHRYLLHVKQYTAPTQDQKTKHPLHIPLRMGLLDADGVEMPLQLFGEASSGDVVRVLDVKQAEQTFEFVNVMSQPVPSLLRRFSAPVKLAYDYTDAQLVLLLRHDNDAFARWEAGQLLSLRCLQQLVHDIQAKKNLALPEEVIAVFKYILCGDHKDKAFSALLLTLPSEMYIADQMTAIDPLAIHEAREFMRAALAQHLRQDLLACYLANAKQNTYDLSNESMGQRELKNVCLSYLMLLDEPQIAKYGVEQYYHADNMTDKFAAFVAIINRHGSERQAVLMDFYHHFQDNDLVLDKWFGAQAGCKLTSTFDEVQALLAHPKFSIKNPNKVRAVVGMFVRNNPGQFNRHNGATYQFLADIVIQLDTLNPQIASRLVEPLTHWQRFIEPHKSQMRVELERIATKELSPDTYEVVTKALA